MTDDMRWWMNRLFGCIDHTTLSSTDTDAGVADFCRHARRLGHGEGSHVAAVCVYSRFVAVAKQALQGSGIGVASVAGAFPHGQLPLELKVAEVRYAVEQGADEVDIVINRGLLLSGDTAAATHEVRCMREACQGRVLKVIIETGDLPSPTLIREATRVAIAGGADFVKTSTGKIAQGATLEGAAVMLQTLREHRDSTGLTVGFKAAGGIRQPDEAVAYARLAVQTMGEQYLHPSTFRIGASSLTENVLRQLQD